MNKSISKPLAGLSVLGVLLLFMLTAPGNHTEAEDAFQYSKAIEAGNGADNFHPHHLLYIPCLKAGYQVFRMLGYDGRAFYLARAVSMCSGALAFGFMFLLGRRFYTREHSRSRGVLAAMALLFSYGFWRYACEAEIYAPALALALGSLCLVTMPKATPLSLSAGVAVSAFAVLIYFLNIVPVVVVAACCYGFLKKQWRYAVLHAMATMVLVAMVYGWIGARIGFQPLPEGTVHDGGINLLSLPRAGVGFGQCLLSANFLFSYESVANLLQEAFPYRIFVEELFLAARITPWCRFLYSMSFIAGIVVVALLVLRLCWFYFKSTNHGVRKILWLWLLLAAAPVLWVEPSNPELWILVLPPFWLLVAELNVSKQRPLLWGMVLVIAIHNATAGIGLMHSKEGDYNAAKASWLIEHANRDDMVNTADSFVFSFYLDYWCRAAVNNMYEGCWKKGDGVTYFCDDVFNIPDPLKIRWLESASAIEGLAQDLRGECVRVHDDEFGGIWALAR